MNRSNQLPWGISLIIVGIIFLLKKLDLFTPALEEIVFNWRNLLLVFGIIFLTTHRNRTIGVVLLLVWGAYYLKYLIEWSRNISDVIWPLLLIIAGAYLIFQGRVFGKKGK